MIVVLVALGYFNRDSVNLWGSQQDGVEDKATEFGSSWSSGPRLAGLLTEENYKYLIDTVSSTEQMLDEMENVTRDLLQDQQEPVSYDPYKR